MSLSSLYTKHYISRKNPQVDPTELYAKPPKKPIKSPDQLIREINKSNQNNNPFYIKKKPEDLPTIGEWERVLKMRAEHHPLILGGNHIDNRIKREKLKLGYPYYGKAKARSLFDPNIRQNFNSVWDEK